MERIFPFFWVTGKKADFEREIAAIKNCGINSICVESRIHPDFCGEGWWKDFDEILRCVEKYDMTVWILDDKHYPTGNANDKVELHPHLWQRRLIADNYDFVSDGFTMQTAVCPDDSDVFLAAFAIPHTDNGLDFDNLIDSKLGQTNKNISLVFNEINMIPHANKVVILFDEIDVIALDRINSNDVREMGRVTSTILRELDRLTDLNKEIVIIATTNLYSNFDKALIRRFDAVINFNRYSKEDLIEVAEFYFSSFVKNFKSVSKDIRLFRKILTVAPELPYPGELKMLSRHL